MAAPIISVATQVPAELTAPNPVVANKAATASNQTFKTELNRAHEHSKVPEQGSQEKPVTANSKKSVAPSVSEKHPSSSVDNSEKTLTQPDSNVQIDESGERNVVEASTNQLVEPAVNEQLNANAALANGTVLPSTGDQLPLDVQNTEQVAKVISQPVLVAVGTESDDAPAALIKGAASVNKVVTQTEAVVDKNLSAPLNSQSSAEELTKIDLASQSSAKVATQDNIQAQANVSTQANPAATAIVGNIQAGKESVDNKAHVPAVGVAGENSNASPSLSQKQGSDTVQKALVSEQARPTTNAVPLAATASTKNVDVPPVKDTGISAVDTNNRAIDVAANNNTVDAVKPVINNVAEPLAQSAGSTSTESEKSMADASLRASSIVSSESKPAALVQNVEELKQTSESVVNALPKVDTDKQALTPKTSLDIAPEAKNNVTNIAVQSKEIKVGAQDVVNINPDTGKQALPNTTTAASITTPVSSNPTQNEQTVSLNQYLDKMRAGVDSVSTEKAIEESASTKPSAAKLADSLQHLNGLQHNLRTTNPVQMQMPVGTPPTARNWSNAVADKVFIAASQNLRVANIQLDPPELGALQIRLQVSGPDQQLSATFNSPHAAVRDALEQQLPRLREMLAEQGISLGESSVNDQGAQSEGGSGFGEQQGSSGIADSENSDALINPLNTQGTVSLVDFYA